MVLFNRSDDASYAAYDLYGYSTGANGYFVIGDSGVTVVMEVFSSSSSSNIQNGPDAVSLYQANDTDFPNDTAATTINLVDAVVYDNNQPDDMALLTGLDETTQFNEDEGGGAMAHQILCNANQMVVL